MVLKIIQKPTNGILGGPKINEFTLIAEGYNFHIKIHQCVQRTIIIESHETDNCKYYLNIFYTLESLLMIFDGHFIPTINAFANDTDITHSWHERTLPSYSSADFVIGTENKLIDYSEVIDEELFEKWRNLKLELDLNFKTMLYCTSSVKMPRDMQCAFLIEAFSGIYTLVLKKYPELKSSPSKGESKLKYYLVAIFEKFGNIIFDDELIINKYEFAQILVNSRNRIAHILSDQKGYFLNGGECVMYLKKLFLLYRIVLFDQLELPQSLYKEKLSCTVLSINSHKHMVEFIEKFKSICKDKPEKQN